MGATTLFRLVIATKLLLAIVGRLATASPSSTRSLASHSEHPVLVVALELAYVIAEVATIIGLWRFRSWSRIANVILLVLVLAAGAVWRRPLFISPTDFLFMYIQQFTEGVLLAMMFLPPLSNLFAKSKA
jgi:hypothetical protein